MLEKRKIHVKPDFRNGVEIFHENLSDLIKIKGHPNYYVNLISGKISYKRGKLKFSTGHVKITDAREYAEAELERRKTGNTLGSIKRRRQGVIAPLMKTYWDELMIHKKVESSENTMLNYRKSERIGFGPFWFSKTINELTPANMQEFKNWYLENHPKRYFRQTFVHFGMLLRYMVEQKYIREMPSLTILESINETTNKNAKRKAPHRFIKPTEVKALFEAIDRYESTRLLGTTTEHKAVLQARARTALTFYFNTGARKMELLSSKWEKVNFEEGFIEIWSSKNNLWRKVPLVPAVVKALHEQKKHTGESPFLFPMPSDPARHISGQVFDHVWGAIKENAEIKGRMRVHDIRHTFATKTGEDGWPPVVACEVLDMSLKTYQAVYCKPGMLSKVKWMNHTFGK